MIGLELLRLELDESYLWAAALAVPGLRTDFPPYVIGILTWGGLRGGLLQGLTPAGMLRRRRAGT